MASELTYTLTPYQEMKLMDRYGTGDMARAYEERELRRMERKQGRMDAKETGPMETEEERGKREDQEREAAREARKAQVDKLHHRDPLAGIRRIFGT